MYLELAKTTVRLPKQLPKKIKQFGLDHDKSITEITIEAYKEYLDEHKQEGF